MGQTKQYVCCKPLGNVSAFKIKKKKKNMSIGREEKMKLRRRRDKNEGKRWRKMKTPKVMPTQ